MDNNYKKFGILELDSTRTGYPVTRSDVIMIVAAIIILIISNFITLPGLSSEGTVSLGIIIFMSLLYACKSINNTVVSVFTMVLFAVMNVMTWNDMVVHVGSSALIMLVTMFIFAQGVLNTNLGQRITFAFLKAFGKSPRGIIVAFYITSAVLSAFIISMPVVVIVLPVAIALLKELKEQPGSSRFGAAVMVAITTGAGLGGAALISGSGINPIGIGILEAVSGGAYSISYTQWALIGIPFVVIVSPFCLWCIFKAFKINKNMQILNLEKEYVERNIRDLGKFSSPETRFVLTLAIMIVLFCTTSMTGLNLNMVCIIGLVLTAIPLWGTVNVKEALPRVSWDVVFMAVTTQIISAVVSTTGLASWLVDLLLGWSYNLPVVFITMIIIFIGSIILVITNTCPVAILIPGLVVMASAIGISPIPLVFAVLVLSGVTCHVPWSNHTYLSYNSGYWTYGQMMKAGWIMLIPITIIGGAVVYGMCSLVF